MVQIHDYIDRETIEKSPFLIAPHVYRAREMELLASSMRARGVKARTNGISPENDGRR